MTQTHWFRSHESPFVTVSKIEHFRFLHWRPCPFSCINEYLTIDSGGNVSDLALARNCCLARMLPGEAELVSEWTCLPGRAKSVKRFERSNGLDTALYKKKIPFYVVISIATEMIIIICSCCCHWSCQWLSSFAIQSKQQIVQSKQQIVQSKQQIVQSWRSFSVHSRFYHDGRVDRIQSLNIAVRSTVLFPPVYPSVCTRRPRLSALHSKTTALEDPPL